MSGTALDFSQLEGLWIAAGGPPQDAPEAAALTVPESSSQPGEIQPDETYSSTGWGLWQITDGSSEPQFGTNYQLLNPFTNAEAAVAKFQSAGNTFRPWTTAPGGRFYNPSTYGPDLAQAQATVPDTNPADLTALNVQYPAIGVAPAGTAGTPNPGVPSSQINTAGLFSGPRNITAPANALGSIFAGIDNFLNPNPQNASFNFGLTSAASPFLTFGVRAAGATLGAMILAFGLYTFIHSRDTQGSAAPSILPLISAGQTQRRLGQADQRLQIQQQNENMRTDKAKHLAEDAAAAAVLVPK